ncbi:MAG: hypothetical protein J6N95_02795 [Bacilli bacterium]|nr:hypothetical protein [Bacilli bacterium]
MARIRINLTIQKHKGYIRLSMDAARLLGKPSYMRILLNPETKELGFQPSTRDDPKALKLPYSEKERVVICSKLLSERVYELCQWNENGTYRTRDYYLSPENILMFKLLSAKDFSKPR